MCTKLPASYLPALQAFLDFSMDMPPQIQRFSFNIDAITAYFERNYDYNTMIFMLATFHGKALQLLTSYLCSSLTLHTMEE